MKIGNRLWDEWLAGEITDAVSAESELAGLVAAMDASVADGTVLLVSRRFWVFHRFRRLWPCCPLGCAHLPSESLKLARGQVALALSAEHYRAILAVTEQDAYIRWAWARGVFGACGGLYAPRSGYYCLVRLREPTSAVAFRELLESGGMTVSSRLKGGRTEVILRDLEDILRLCHNLGLSTAAQTLQDRGLVRSLRDRANRQANCDDANIRRSVATAHYQCRLAVFLLDRGVELSEALAQTIDVRLRNPSASLAELGTLLLPPVSKSTIKYRWQRIQRMAEERGFRSPT